MAATPRSKSRAVSIDSCPLCGDSRDDADWFELSNHIARDHGPGDAGLPPIPEDLLGRPDFTTAEATQC